MNLNFTVPRAMPLSTLAQTMNIPAESLMQANNITNPNAMLMPGTQLMFPDAFGGGGGLFQALAHLFGLDGAMPLPPPGMGQQQSEAAAGNGVGGPSSAPRPMHRSQPSGWSHPINAIRDRYKQFQGQPLDGDSVNASEDGLGNKKVDAPFVGADDAAAQASPDAKGDVHVNTPHVTQWNAIACKDASDVVVKRTGGQPRDPNQRVQVATSRSSRNGEANVSPAAAQAGLERINSELDKGHAVEVGVAHDNGGGHNAQTGGMTDHFVAITGRGTDEQGRRFYTFHDPATQAGSDRDPHCRFYVDPNTGGLYRPRASNTFNKWLNYRYEMTEVR